jgi:amidase
MATWQEKAKAKRDAVNSLIPEQWRLKFIPTAEEQRDITGEYLWQFLSKTEVQITESTAEQIVHQTTSGHWKAEDVAKAFCHRAALAHQFVRLLYPFYVRIAIGYAHSYLAQLLARDIL